MKRVCEKCGVEKEIEDFTEKKDCCQSRTHVCVSCTKKQRAKRYLKNKEKILKQAKDRYIENRESILKDANERYAKNVNGRRDKRIAYSKNNRERIRATSRKYWSKNKEKKAEKDKRYQEKNKVFLAGKKKEHYEKNRESYSEKGKERYVNKREVILAQNREYRVKNKDELDEKASVRSKARVENLEPVYIKQTIRGQTGLRNKEITQEMIEEKRELLLIHRKLKEIREWDHANKI